ncbi:hypothetical protein BZA77DRAFT_299385 [Pyronema omphalodes]|nr:hypothetical protein BZA77DRAFT_299385 [Pyronema omphalodes]
MSTFETPAMEADGAEARVLLTTFDLSALSPPTGTTHLSLTADFPLDQYETVLTNFSLPLSLPSSINSLDLSLFTYGYPVGFLTGLIRLLPNLRYLSVFTQLIAGTTAESFHDASTFLRTLLESGLEELVLFDVFVPSDFFTSLVGEKEWTLKKLQLLYTFRSQDPEFNTRLQTGSMAALMREGLTNITVKIVAENEMNEGFKPCAGATSGVVERLMEWSDEKAEEVRSLSLCAFSLTGEAIDRLARKFKNVEDVDWAVAVDGVSGMKRGLMDSIGEKTRSLNIVVDPGMGFFVELMKDKDMALNTVLWNREDIEAVSKLHPGLRTVNTSILNDPKLGFSEWIKNDDVWSCRQGEGADLTDKEKAVISKREQTEGSWIEKVA